MEDYKAIEIKYDEQNCIKRGNYLRDLGYRISVTGDELTGNLLYELNMIMNDEDGIEAGLDKAIDMRETEERDRSYYLS